MFSHLCTFRKIVRSQHKYVQRWMSREKSTKWDKIKQKKSGENNIASIISLHIGGNQVNKGKQ